jgi:hypothetical protein
VDDLRRLALSEGSRWRQADMAKLNNAWFDLYRLYEGESDLYERFCRQACDDSLSAFIQR